MSTQVRPCLSVQGGGAQDQCTIYHYDPVSANMTVGTHLFCEKNECLTILPQDEQGAALVFGVPSGVLRCGPTKTSDSSWLSVTAGCHPSHYDVLGPRFLHSCVLTTDNT